MNELVLALSLVFIFGGVLWSYQLFGEDGLMMWTVIATITANIEVMILVDAFGMSQTLGNVLFASTFLVTDILSEVSGKERANRAVNIGIATSVCFIILTQSWFFYLPSRGDTMLPSVQAVFSNTPRLMVVGLVVYAVAQRFDVWLYHWIWGVTEKRSGSRRAYLWLRNNGSTLTSQMLNTLLFTLGAFWGVYDIPTLVSIGLSSYVIFIFTSLLDTPVVYLARRISEKKRLSVQDS